MLNDNVTLSNLKHSVLMATHDASGLYERHDFDKIHALLAELTIEVQKQSEIRWYHVTKT